MPSHVHTPPQCGFWTGHDPSCFDQAFGVERDCVLIEQGKNKGSYLCIHERAPITSLGREDKAVHMIAAGGARLGEQLFERVVTPTIAEEYGSINAELRPPSNPAPPPTDPAT